jgi:hypothetical protein
MRRMLALLIAATLALTTASAALGADRATTGDRINLFNGDQELPAGAPFFVRHGIANVLGDDRAVGRMSFVLEIDGVQQLATYTEHHVADGMLTQTWVFNYPGGMSGTHTFIGHWLGVCGLPTAYLPCGDGGPGTLVEFTTEEITVTFTD